MQANPNIIRVHRFVLFSAHATSLFYLIMMVVRKFGTLCILIIRNDKPRLIVLRQRRSDRIAFAQVGRGKER